MNCGRCMYRKDEWSECEVYHMHVDYDEERGCTCFMERSCGNCKYLGGSCDGPYGYDNTCNDWELREE